MDKDTAPVIKSVLSAYHYDPESGEIRRVSDGRKAGSSSKALGYVEMALGTKEKRVRFYGHQFAVLAMTGDWPLKTQQVDHINGNRADNRWSNLRVVDIQQNRWNRHHVSGAVPFKGVYLHRGTRYCAQIHQHDKRIYIGVFHTPEAAARAYDAKAIELFGEFAKTNFPAT